MLRRERLLVKGTVQGVGFRPFVWRLATEESLAGFVRNDGRGVTIEVQGDEAGLARFAERLAIELPRPGQIDELRRERVASQAGASGFTIAHSETAAARSMALAPDGALCPDCLAEMHDPANRRYRYPFITCTRCGPRYTITRALPYDRPNTTMAGFAMCADCRREYEDVRDRRYHAQPIACPACGPRAWLVCADGSAGAPTEIGGARDAGEQHPPQGSAAPRQSGLGPEGRAFPDQAIVEARRLLLAGQVVAIKGIGGFHLAVNARDVQAVARLRARKRRPRKPLAVMVRDLATAAQLVALGDDGAALLSSYAAPILLARARCERELRESIAPGLLDLGIFLPYSPLHALLLDESLDAVVLTSGNAPSEPICTSNEEALATLPADAFLLHDREIHVACDDSVVRTAGKGTAVIRRSRGFVPVAVDANHLPARSVLALGGELKSTVATLQAGELVVGRHLGDLDNPRAEQAFVAEIERMLAFGAVVPEAVAVDLHPEMFSTTHAESAFSHLPLVRVQHHHAHMAAVMIEHHIEPTARVAAIVLDGLGYGPDGAIWGGEVLAGTYADFERVAHLRYVPQPGGDRAAREPRRMATSLLWDSGIAEHAAFDDEVAAICAIERVSPKTSSTGRLFDGVAALLGIAPEVQEYEGEAAARLEAAVDASSQEGYMLPLVGAELDTRVLVESLVSDSSPAGVRAARFHLGLADGLALAALSTGEKTVVLAGGSLVNRLLRERLVARLAREGKKVLLARRLPVGDGALSAGQAAVAACRLSSDRKERFPSCV